MDQAIRDIFSQIKTVPEKDLISVQHQKNIDLARAKADKSLEAVKTTQKDHDDLKAETIKVICGESKLDAELLTTLVHEAQEKLASAQAIYTAKKLDDMVEQIMLYQFGKIQASDGRMIAKQAHEQHIKEAKATCHRCKKELENSQKELADYQSEILRIIRGDSSFTQDMLAPLVSKAQADVERLMEEYQAAAAVKLCGENAEQEMKEYKQLQTWADLYRSCTFEAKKMIVSRFIKSIHVYSDYKREIEFNVSFEDFRLLAVEPEIAENNTQLSERTGA